MLFRTWYCEDDKTPFHVGKDDTVHIAYHDVSNSAFKQSKKMGSTWQVEPIDVSSMNPLDLEVYGFMIPAAMRKA